MESHAAEITRLPPEGWSAAPHGTLGKVNQWEMQGVPLPACAPRRPTLLLNGQIQR